MLFQQETHNDIYYMAHCYCTRGTVKWPLIWTLHLGLYTYRIVMTQYLFVIAPDTRGMSVMGILSVCSHVDQY